MSNTNAKSEFLSHTSGLKVLCAKIRHGSEWSDNSVQFILTTGFTKDEYDKFLSDLNFEYDSGYGGQELFGLIWYVDGTWSERYEYDGSDCWEYKYCPEIPEELNRIDKVRDQKLNTIL